MFLKYSTSFIFIFFLFIGKLISQESHIDSTAFHLYEKGEEIFNPRKPDTALFYFQKAIVSFKKDSNWEYYVRCLNRLANLSYLKLEFGQMEEYILEAIETSEKYLDKTNVGYSEAVFNYGFLLIRKGDYDGGIKQYKKSLNLDLKYGGNKLDIAASYHNLGVQFRNQGDYKESIDHHNKALSLRRDSLGENSSKVALSYLMLGNANLSAGDQEKALDYFNAYLGITYQHDLPERGSDLSNLISCYQRMSQINIEQKNYSEATKFIQKAINYQKAENTSRHIASYEIRGHLNSEIDKPVAALQDYLEANNRAEVKYKRYDKHITKARTKRHIGDAYARMENYEKGLEYYQLALIDLAFDFADKSVYTNPPSGSFILKIDGLQIMEAKAMAFFYRYKRDNNQKDLIAALESYNFASQLVDEIRQSYLSQESKLLLAEKAPDVYEGGIKSSFELYKYSQDEKYLEQAFAFAERNKSMLLLESLQHNEAILSAEIPDDEIEKERKLKIEMAFYENEINRQRRRVKRMDTIKVKEWENKIFDLRQEYNDLVKSFEQKYPGYYKLKHNQSIIGIAELQEEVLAKNTMLLEYFIGKETIYIFSVSQNELKVSFVNIPEDFEDSIQSLSSLFSHPPQSESFIDECKSFGAVSWKLSELLLKNTLQALPSSTDRLIIIPDGILAYLPFEVLLTNKPQENPINFSSNYFNYLLSQYSVSYSYSSTLLTSHILKKNQTNLKPFIGYAPTFGEKSSSNSRGCTDDEQYTLHCTKNEVESINDLFNGDIVLGTLANVSSFLDQAENYRIIHLATHACSDSEDVNQNKIWFSDDYLSNTELSNLSLNSELAVLSACETGTGKLAEGEGILSLSRGFILAGCPSTLTSLWSVDDCATSDIMLRYYKYLTEGQFKDVALQKAKLDYFSGADNVGGHPYYWAAFIQSGNIEEMNFSAGVSKKWLWIFLSVLLVVFGYWKFSATNKI